MNNQPKILIVVALMMPLLYYVCFHYGWNNSVHNWWWVCCGWTAAGLYGTFHAFQKPTSRVHLAALNAVYLLMIFSLSVFTILEGWGMTPRNWWLVVIPYCAAAALPPFDSVSRYLLWWRPLPKETGYNSLVVEWLTSACVEALNSLSEDATPEDRANAIDYIRDQLTAIGDPAIRQHVEDNLPEQG